MVQDTGKNNRAKSFSDPRSHDPAGKGSEHSNSRKQLAFKHSALKVGGNCFLEKKIIGIWSKSWSQKKRSASLGRKTQPNPVTLL